MPEQILESFHFLRPWWLLLIPFAVFLHLRLRRVVSASDQWRGIIDAKLLGALVVGASAPGRFRPYQLLSVVIVLLSLALAGPSWQRELTPFTEDRAPLVIALEMSDSMNGVDQPPSRLERAKQKIRDLLAIRGNARTAVVAYAGSAHAVLPLTDDVGLIELYLDSLSSELMPVAGERPDLAMQFSLEMLSAESATGSLLFLTDGIDGSWADDFRAGFRDSSQQLLILALGSSSGGPLADGTGLAPPVDLPGLQRIADASGGWLTTASVDDSDVLAVYGRVQRHLVDAIEADENLRWKDAGYALVWPLALLLLAWFRRGWTIQWQ